MGTLIYNGVSTKDLGVVIQTPPSYEIPTKDYDVLHIGGKTGDVVIDKGSYTNIKRVYRLAKVFNQKTSFVDNATALTAWLMSANGYTRLEDSYEPDYYRMALYRSENVMNNYYDIATAIDVTFECKPQRWLKSGELYTDLLTKNTYIHIYNPLGYISLPEIIIDGKDLIIEVISGDINNPTNRYNVETENDGLSIIDSDLQDYYNDTEFLNNKLKLLNNTFPKLHPGDNWIKITGGTFRSAKIKPRWWTL